MSDINNSKGISIIEMMVTLLIVVIVLAVLFTTFIRQRNILKTQELITEMHQNIRAALYLMLSEIRLAGLSASEVDFDGIVYSKEELQLRIDMNGDGDTSDSHEFIKYKFYPEYSQIRRETQGGGYQAFVDNIEDFRFIYYDANCCEATKSEDINMIKIIITGRTARPDPHYHKNSGYRQFSLTSCITPRNTSLKDK